MTTRIQLDRERDELAASSGPVPTLAPAPDRVASIARLQRGAGNAAVSRMLARRPVKGAGGRSGAQIMRYDSFEHASAGDAAAGSQKVVIAGETLTSGEINALADLYGSPEALMQADPAELKKVIALVRRQVAGERFPESEWDKATGDRYTALNLKNEPHFSPHDDALVARPVGPPTANASGDNRSTFTRYYCQTVDLVMAAGLEQDKAAKRAKLEQSVVTAGFAEHYLMDAFSAGHLFNKADVIAQLEAHFAKLSNEQLGTMFGSIATEIESDPKLKELLGQYEPADRPPIKEGSDWHLPFRPNFDTTAAFKGLLEVLYKDEEGHAAVTNGIVKVIHDELSTHQNGSGAAAQVGVRVKNAQAEWTMSGDRTLDQSPETELYMKQAVETFRQLIASYKSAPRSLSSPDQDIASVTDLFPRPTAASETMIAELIKRCTDAGTGTRQALVALLRAELPSLLETLVSKKRIRRA